MITGIIEVTQDPEQAGSTLKILSLRLRGMKGQLEELGEETDENVENISKMQGQILNLTNGKVNIFDGSEFRSTYEIMNDIAEVWDDLGSTAQADLLETIAGKHRANSVAALLSNWENVEAAVKSASDAEGSAARENAKYVDSIQGRLDKLTTSWQSFANTSMSSDFLKGAISALTSFVEGIEGVIDTFGLFPTLLTAFGMFQSFKGKGIFKPVIDEATGAAKGITSIFGKAANSVKTSLGNINIDNGFSASLNKSDIQALIDYQGQLQSGIDKTNAWNDCMANASTAAQDAARSNAFLSDGLHGYIKSQQAANISTLASSKSLGTAKTLLDEYYSGCKTTGMGVDDFRNAVAKTNPQLAAQMNAAGNATSGLISYTAATVGARIGAAALKVGVMALNSALTMGIGLIVGELISGIMSWINSEEELAEKVEEVTSKFKQQSDELKKLKSDYDTTKESSMISRYEKLSKGVDNLGRNVSLTADEYSDYQSIVNQIADQIPSLVSGYDSQGNALLSCKGNVEELTKAYEKLIHVNNQSILAQNNQEIEDNWKNVAEQASGYGFFESIGNFFSFDGFFGGRTDDYDMKTYTAEWLNGLTSDMSVDDIEKQLGQKAFRKDEVIEALMNAGYGVNQWSTEGEVAKTLKKILEKEPKQIKNILDNYYAKFDDAVAEYKTKATALLSEAFDIRSSISGLNYGNISEELQAIAYQTVNSLDFDFLNNLSESGKTIEQWTKEMLNQLNSIGEGNKEQIENAFDLQTKLNDGDIDYGDYISKLKEVRNIIDGLELKDEAKNQLKISLGLDENGVVAQYDALIKRLTTGAENSLGLDATAVKKFVDDLSAEEYAVLAKLKLEPGTTLDEIKSLIKDKLAEEFTFDIKVQTEGVEALNTALAESRSAAGLTSESIAALKARYEDLDGFNAAALFEKTANGIHLNSQELSRLEEQYIATNKLEIDKNLNTLVEKYQDVNEELKTNVFLTEDERKELEASKESLADKIDELSTLSSQYDGLTSAFNKWQTALNGAEEGDNYDSLYENLESIKELRDKGLVGTDKFKTAAQLMTNEDLSNADIDEYVSAFDKGYPKMLRYFTEGQKGCKNFLNDVHSLNSEWAHMNEDGSWEINFNTEEVAKELDVSVDFVLQIAKKLKDYGFEVNLEDSSVDSLKTKIEQTEAKLKELGQSPVDINVDIEASSSNLNKIESEIEKAKSKIAEINNSSVSPEVKTAQLEDAKAKLEALIDKKQEASQPAFMNLNTSQVNASLVDALEKVQAYQNAINEVNKLSELKDAGISIDDSQLQTAKEKVDECAKAIQGLDGDVKVAIGLEEDGSIDSIKKSFEDGKVTIDANTDPAYTKIEQLADNVDKIEDKDVTINVTVNGLDKVKELNKQVDLATDIDGDIDKLSKYVESARALKELGENTTSYITAEIKGNVIDEFEYKINNLKVFSDSAKDLEEIGFVKSEVTADIKGNVTDEFEYKIDNLKVFANSAKDIHKIGNVESNVKATINSGEDGDVIDEFEYKLNNLGEFAKHVKELQGLGDVDISVKATINSGENGDVIDEFEYKLDNLSEFAKHVNELQGLQNVDISVNAVVNTGENGDVVDTFEYKLNNLRKFADYVKELQGLSNVNVSVNATVNTGEDGDAIDTFEYKLNNLETFADGAKALQNIGSVSSEITAKVNTGESGDAVDTFEYKLNNLKTFADGAKALQGVGNVTSVVTAEINSGSDGDVIDEFEYKLDNLEKFAGYARDLQGIGDVSVSVSAKVNVGKEGDVADTFEYKLNNLEEFSSYAKDLQGLEDVDISIKANVDTGGDSATEEWEYKLNNLDEFADYAKSLQSLESVDITITANAKGNVVGKKTEGKINNLEVFAKGAKGLSNIESKEITITANAKGNVVGKKTEGKINNLEVFAVGAKKVQNLESKDITITANAKGNVTGKKTESKINNLEVFAKGAKSLQGISSKTVEITANAYGNVVGKKTEGKINNLKVFGDSAKALSGVSSKTVEITANANGNVVSGDGAAGRLSSLTEFKSLISGMSNQTVTVSVTANVDAANINQAITLLTNVANSGVFKDYKATVQVGAKIATIDDTTVKNYKAPSKDGKVKYSVDPESAVFTWTAPSKDGVVNYSASVEALTDSQKYKTGTITYKAKISGFPVVNGTANANGSAFANGTNGKAYKQGDWGVKQTTTALTGELGQELVVYGNRFWTVGDHGAEFATIPKGAIVFNHKQTEELFKNGKVTSDGGRGRTFANGTAYADGTAFITGSGSFIKEKVKKTAAKEIVVDGGKTGTIRTVTLSQSKEAAAAARPEVRVDVEPPSGNQGDINSTGIFTEESSDVKHKFEETIDWIETILDRAERAINKYEQQADSAFKSWDSRDKALDKQISVTETAISRQTQAKDYYDDKLDTFDWGTYGDGYESKIKDGTIAMEPITDENLSKKIKEYQDLYEKSLDAEEKIIQLKEDRLAAYEEHFNQVQDKYDGILQGFEHTESMLNEYISQAEEQGHLVSEKYYDALIENEKQNIATLKQEQAALISARNEAEANGIDKNSESYINMCNEIDSVTRAIEEGNTALIKYNNAIRDLDFEKFDLIQERISDITSEAEFLIELMSNKDLFDDNGKLTEQGIATIGLHGQNYNTYMYQADDYGAKVAEIDSKIASGEYDKNDVKNLLATRREYLETQREMILNAEGEKNAIKDLVEEGINLELDALQERIDLHNEELDSMKDLYDYQKNVEEQTANIASLRKQIGAYEGFDDEEARAKVQELKVSLEEAEADLQETEWDRYINQQSQLLDALYTEYETILNSRLNDVNYWLEQVVNGINIAAGAEGTITSALGAEGAIAKALGTSASTIGETLKTEVGNVGTKLSTAMSNIWLNDGSGKAVIDLYGKDFQTKQTTTNATLNNIKADVAAMVDDVDKEAQKKVVANKTSTSAKKDPTKNTTPTTKPTTNNNKSSGDGKAKVGDKVKFIEGKYYYDSQGKKPLGSKNLGKEVYITKISTHKWSTYPYHISTGKTLGTGDLGWVKKKQIEGYAAGKKKISNNEYAWTQENGQEYIIRPSDGAILTPVAKGDSVLNTTASGNIWSMANNPAEFIKDNLGLDAANIPNGANVNNNVTQHFENINFNMPNVHSYNELITEMQRDPKFEKLILAMTLDQVAGKSKLGKNKAIR